ncbi:hypothetical protein [uncultured Thomasclavelia sp.]|uniref:hypothetical protein n=1 Tax=uncultured Thomasclavelia sp. TaxID=3025759 RepID=UPI0025DDDCCE|nr:hypothetical protein [uncultured Thomasclavelia sp.]
MKQSYWCVYDQDIISVKRYLLKLCDDIQDVHDLINQSMDLHMLKRKISKNKEIEILVFTRIKRLIDRVSSFEAMEYHLIMMNILIDQHFYPLLVYKYKLLNHILELGGFSVEIYCLLRHLIKYSPKVIEPFVLSVCQKLNFSQDKYYYLICRILLLEKEYKKVYHYFKYVSIDDEIERYLPALYNYNPRLYRKYAKMMYVPIELIND